MNETNKQSISVSITNPASDKIHVKNSNNFPINFTVMDLLGNEIKSGKKFPGDFSIDVREIPDGLYLIRFDSKQNSISKKVVIVK
jgi:hypothetical protein